MCMCVRSCSKVREKKTVDGSTCRNSSMAAWRERELLGHSHDSSSCVPPQLPLTDSPKTNDLFVQNLHILHTPVVSEYFSVVCELAYYL